jgi:hypothetical protein
VAGPDGVVIPEQVLLTATIGVFPDVHAPSAWRVSRTETVQ